MHDNVNLDTLEGQSSGGAGPEEGPRGAVVVDSPDTRRRGSVLPIDAGSSLSIGRTSADLVIDDVKMSRLHLTIRRVGGGRDFEIRDHDSRNGTRVNGVPIHGAVVSDDAIVRVGDTIVAVGLLPAAAVIRAGELVGWSAAFGRIVAQAERIASSAAPVLLLGETGTGKDLVARYLHQASGRPGRFLAINCAAIPADLVESTLFGHKKGAFTGATSDSAGYFDEASAGTLLLDEVGELGPAAQPKLLRVLESGEFSAVGGTTVVRADVRVVSASNRDLEAHAAAGLFRRDLFARLAAHVIRLPPLRARRADILGLLRHFWGQLAPDRELRCTAGFVENLLLHPWPLNVRELRIVAQRLLVLDVADAPFSGSHLREVLMAVSDPPEGRREAPVIGRPVLSAGRRASRPGKAQLAQDLAEADGNVSKVAERYGKDPKQIYRWLRRYGLSADDFRRD